MKSLWSSRQGGGLSLLLSSVFLLLAIDTTRSVDRTNFKTCEQSGFCRRHRAFKPELSEWHLVADSVKEDKQAIECELKHESNGAVLKMSLTSLLSEGSVLRIYINELESERLRYEAKDALLPDIKQSKLTLKSSGDSGFEALFGPNKAYRVAVTGSPFRIDVFEGEKILMSGNQRGLLKFEHYRKRPEASEGGDHQDMESDKADGLWEETFKSHTDSKPFGPMSVGMDFSFIGMDHVYGIPEHADAFSLKNTKGSTDPYRLYNLDVFEYELNNPMALYGSVPVMLAHSSDKTLGMMWLNPSETWVDIESSANGVVGLLSNFVSGESKSRLTHWISETGVIDIYLMMGPTPRDVMAQNAQLAGTTPLPPYYSIGYHQCRWNYFSQEEVYDVDQGFDEHDIPLDAIWLDIEYTEGRSKKYFTWDPNTFSDPKTLTSNLTVKGRRLIAIIDPHIKKESHYPVYNEAVENNYFIKTKEGGDYDGWCWPGSSMWPDYTSPAVAKWWANKFNPEFFPGFAGGIVDIWNDMNEPSIFNGPEITAHKDVKHYNGMEHRDVHNIYGFLMTKSTYDGLVTHRPNFRAFILTRAFFVGSQRYCAAWTGDNMSKWEHLKATVPMILSMSVVGMTFAGADVPGFFFNPESTELVVRWYQAGAFQPFFRAHAHLDTRRREPWLFDEATKLHIKHAIRTRYTYLPYMYTLFYENSVNGMPPVRPLWFHFPTDTLTYSMDESYLLGDALLVHPVTEKGVSSIQVYFPGDSNDLWLDLETNEGYEGGKSYPIPVTLSKIPLFQRSKTIVPKRERFRRSAALTLHDPITLDIVLDAEAKHASGQLYLDDGSTFNHAEGDFIHATISFDDNILSYRLIDGKHNTKAWLERINIYRFPVKPSSIEATSGESNFSLKFKYDATVKSLVIRKPGFVMSQNWQIKIK